MKRKRIIALILVIVCMFSFGDTAFAAGGSGGSAEAAAMADEAFSNQAGCAGGTLLASEEWMPAGANISDWLAIAFALNGVPEDYSAYLEELKQYVEDKYAGEGGLDSVICTEYHRTALAVLALGGNPRSFGEDASGAPIDLVADGIWDFEAGVDKQGLNGPMYALIVLDSMNYEVPAGETVTREWLIDRLLESQNEDGGFGFMPGASNVDMTAMVLTSLAPYKDAHAEEIDRALEYIASAQNEEGQFEGFGYASSEAASQVIIALCSLGIDPEKDDRFIKNGISPVDALEIYHLPDGSYCHLAGEEWDVMATEQALIALKALDRFRSGGPNIYDFKGYELTINEKQESNTTLIIIAVLAAVLCCAAALIISRRKKNAEHHQ